MKRKTIAFAVTVCLFGCSSTQTTQTPQVDECGNYAVDVQLPSSTCETDSDCAWTARRPGTCVGPVCDSHYRAGAKAWVAAVEEMHQRICGNAKWEHCDRYKCIHREPTGVACREGKCELSF